MIKPLTVIIAAACGAASLGAQQPAIRQLGPVVATAKETFGNFVFVRHTKNGVIVNDQQNRRVLLLDPTLANSTVIADSTPATANAYSGRSGGLVAYKGDSSLFIDAQSMSMLVIDPAGKIVRVMSIPRTQDAMVLGNAMIGTPGLDPSGKLVYRSMPRFEMRRPPAPANGASGGGNGPMMMAPDVPDTTAVIRVDLATRAVDTLGFLKVPKMKMDVQRDENGRFTMTSMVNPLPLVDEWALLADGSVALIRGRDYHIDWVRPDGTRSSSPKIPFEWQRLTDEDKGAFIDSVKAARARLAAAAPAPGTPGGAPANGGGAAGAAGGEARVMIMGGDGPQPPQRGGNAPAGGGPPGMTMNFVPASELPDYKPPFFAGNGAVRPDLEGRIWVRTIPTKAVAGGLVYDVINNKGELVERVQIPKDRTIVGFGQDGVVYLAFRDGTVTKLEKARMK